MSFPTGNSISTTNLSSGTGNPASARTDLLNMANYVNAIIDSANSANGVLVLNTSGQIGSSMVPATMAPTGILTLAPASGKIKIEDVLRLQVHTKTQVLALTDNAVGDIVLSADDLTGANAQLCVYDGSVWKIFADLSGLTTLS